MINTFRYSGQGEVEKDGKKLPVLIPPALALNQMGAFIQVTLTHPRTVQEKFKEQGKGVPTVSVNAIIDTGASGSVITPKVADQLGLIQTGFQKVSSVQDEQLRPVYYGFIIFLGYGKRNSYRFLPA